MSQQRLELDKVCEEMEAPFFTPVDIDFPMDAFGESTRGDLRPSKAFKGTELTDEEVSSWQQVLDMDRYSCPRSWGAPARSERSVFCSRGISMRAIQCIGYDMDYTLIHYKVEEWEGRAYHYAKEYLNKTCFNVEGLQFQPDLVCRGLIIDKELGNMVKVDRHGYVRRAMHGTNRMTQKECAATYGREVVDLRDSRRWVFLNTLFSVSEGCLFMQLVQRMEEGTLLPCENDKEKETLQQMTYDKIFRAVSRALFLAHIQGRLKNDVMSNPAKYVECDKEVALALLDQKESGKYLALITNSDWDYTKTMMSNVFDPQLRNGGSWRDLFDLVIVSARKPSFFSANMPLYEIVSEDGLMKERYKMKRGRVYAGGTAAMVENCLGCSADDIMFVGDHIFTDVNIAKSTLRWRTVLIMRELEDEVLAMEKGRLRYEEILTLLKRRARRQSLLNHLRVEMNRVACGRKAQTYGESNARMMQELMAKAQSTAIEIDNKINPLIFADGRDMNPYWGYITRAGLNDKSHIMKQIEKHADLYTSRVSNFYRYTPYMYFRSSVETWAHHRNIAKNYEAEEVSVLEAIFNKYDADGNGQIDREEFLQLAAETKVFESLSLLRPKKDPVAGNNFAVTHEETHEPISQYTDHSDGDDWVGGVSYSLEHDDDSDLATGWGAAPPAYMTSRSMPSTGVASIDRVLVRNPSGSIDPSSG